MAFVRRKNVRGYTYYQLVRNYREEGKHRQEMLAHLGHHESLEAAILAEDRKVAADLAYYERRISYWLDEAEDIRRSAQRMYQSDYRLAGQEIALLDREEAYSRELELDQQYEEDAKRSGDSEGAWDRAYGKWEAGLVMFSIRYHEANAEAAYYEECAIACQARLDWLLLLLSKYPQPMRSLRTLELLNRREAQMP